MRRPELAMDSAWPLLNSSYIISSRDEHCTHTQHALLHMDSAGFNIHTTGTYMSAHIIWNQLCSSCTWFTWRSGELSSEGRFSMGSAASATSASNKSGWVRLRGLRGRCMVRLSVLVLLDLASRPRRFFNPTCLDLARGCFSCDSDWFRLDVHSVYHLFSFDRESLFLTAESLHHNSAWMCRSNLLQSQPASRVACHLMPAVPADARAATSVVG